MFPWKAPPACISRQCTRPTAPITCSLTCRLTTRPSRAPTRSYSRKTGLPCVIPIRFTNAPKEAPSGKVSPAQTLSISSSPTVLPMETPPLTLRPTRLKRPAGSSRWAAMAVTSRASSTTWTTLPIWAPRLSGARRCWATTPATVPTTAMPAPTTITSTPVTAPTRNIRNWWMPPMPRASR